MTSNASKAFTFNIVYHPSDCIVTLQKVNPNNTLGPATNAVVANCGERGLNPRGGWAGSNNYLTNDVVTSAGSSWRAKRNNFNQSPATNADDWEQLAAKGMQGVPGAPGEDGQAGAPGADGQDGAPARMERTAPPTRTERTEPTVLMARMGRTAPRDRQARAASPRSLLPAPRETAAVTFLP